MYSPGHVNVFQCEKEMCLLSAHRVELEGHCDNDR